MRGKTTAKEHGGKPVQAVGEARLVRALLRVLLRFPRVQTKTSSAWTRSAHPLCCDPPGARNGHDEA